MNKVVTALLFVLVTVYCDVFLDKLKLPNGWKIEQLASVPNARQMSVDKDETVLFVGNKDGGKLYAVPLTRDDANLKYTAGASRVIKANLNAPVGVAFDDETGDLYVSEVPRILRFKQIKESLGKDAEAITYETLPQQYPTNFTNGWKYIKLNKGRIYVPQGTPCNRCNMDLPYGTLTSIKKDGTDYTVHARGIRNTVGFDFHPTTGNIWFTDNSATKDETSGEDRPGDELNEIIPSPRIQHFGYPYCYEKDYVDTDFNVNNTCEPYVPAKYVLGAHVAALGMDFYQAGTKNTNIPQEFKGNNIILIAEHGSINRSVNVGYRVTMVNLTIPTAEAYTVFIEGWMDTTTGKAWGRPVDVLMLSDGSFLISDDRAGVIYRVYYATAATIKLWAYIAFPLLFLVALSAVGAGVYFFNKYQKAKAPQQEEEFQRMEEEDL